MGMFDYVRYEAPCPLCGHPVKNWQTKDSGCYMQILEPGEVMSFYAPCPKCRAWIDAVVAPPTKIIVTLTATPYEAR